MRGMVLGQCTHGLHLNEYIQGLLYKMYNIGIKRNNVKKVNGEVLERDKLLTKHVKDYISNNEGYEYEKLTNEKIRLPNDVFPFPFWT